MYSVDGNYDAERRKLLVWKGAVSSDILSKSRFRVEAVEGHADQIRLSSVHFPGQYIYAPEIDYDAQRRQLLIWKGAAADTNVGSGNTVMPKARFGIEVVIEQSIDVV